MKHKETKEGQNAASGYPLLGDECDHKEILRNAYLKDGVYFAIVNDYSMGFNTTRIVIKNNKFIVYKSVSDCKAGNVIIWHEWMTL